MTNGRAKGDLHVIPDATRVGTPAEESMQTPVFMHAHSMGVVLPSMAILSNAIEAYYIHQFAYIFTGFGMPSCPVFRCTFKTAAWVYDPGHLTNVKTHRRTFEK